MLTPADIRRLFREQGLTPKKWMGQNLLVDPYYLKGIVTAARVTLGEKIIEIGAGLGVLTEELVRAGADVWALEVDRGFFRVLEQRFSGSPQVTLIHADALRYDFPELGRELGRLRVVANLPYNISSRLIFTFYEQRDIFCSLHVLLQREVAQRLVAGPGTRDYGVLTVLLGAVASVEILFDIPPRAFYPVPAVFSSLVAISFPERPPVAVTDARLFTKLIKTAFASRRKTLRNTLRGLALPCAPGMTLASAAEAAGIDLSRRAETLSAAEFAGFADALGQSKG